MKKQKIQTKISISVFILAILAMSSVFSIFAPNAIIWGNDEIDDTFNEEVLAISQGDDPWWDGDWQYRQCINVTNTGSYNLTDNSGKRRNKAISHSKKLPFPEHANNLV